MLTTRNLTSDAGTAIAELPADAKPKGELAPLPSWAMAVPTVPNDMPAGMQTTYIGQLNPSTGKRASLISQGVKDGDYYIDDGAAVLPLRPLKFFLMAAEVFRTAMNTVGDITAATRDVDAKEVGGIKVDEHAVCHVVAIVNGSYIPAKVDFRKAQFDAARQAVDGAKLAATPDFPSKGEAFKIAAQFPFPFGRMTTAVVGILEKIAKTGPGVGKKYYATDAQCSPASLSDMEALGKALQDESFRKQLDSTRAAYEYRVAQIAKLVK